MQEAASITIGNAPSALQAQSRSTISLALWRWASPNPFELQGNPQQMPTTPSGTQTDWPARPETSTSASTGEPPKIRLVQEGT